MTNLMYMFVLIIFEAEEMQWVKTLWAWINILYDLYIGKYCAEVYGI